jgi:SulP family sulfate permease
MGHSSKRRIEERTPIGRRHATHGVGQLLIGVTRDNRNSQLLAGVTLLAIAIPEQLATAQLADVPAFSALVAFIAASLVFFFVGSNPIVSVGADSTIAPLFAVALLRISLPASSQYLSLLAATAVITGLIVMAIGLLKLGWLADFLSLPIVAGFMCGIGVIIIVHQLPRVLGVASGGDLVVQRLANLSHHLGQVSAWSMVIALGTLAVMVAGERLNPRLPWALGAVVGVTILCAAIGLAHHGVQELGSVTVGPPTWRLSWLSAHEWGVVVTTSLTLVVVIISQSAATSRTSADEIGVADDLSRDFVGVGLANVVAGLVGTFPVNASPARTTVTRLAGGRTKLVGLVAAMGALMLTPFASIARTIPMAALAGVLLFIAGRLIKIGLLRTIWRTSRLETLLAIVATLGVVLLGVELGLATAVGLAILDQTWRSARPRIVELGRHAGTTSWEPLDVESVERVDHIMAVLFEQDIYFANAGVFRRKLHDLLLQYPLTKHLIIDAVAITSIDYTGLVMLSQVVEDLTNDSITIAMARANDELCSQLTASTDKAIRHIRIFASVDAAANDALRHHKH